MNKRLLLSILSMALAGAAVYSAPIRPDKALGIASDFVSSATSRKIMNRVKNGSSQMKLAYTHTDKASGLNAFYVFTRGVSGGYVLVSGDDRAPLILGYTDNGSFDGKDIPQSMRGMIESWSDQIVWLAAHPSYKAAVPPEVAAPIAPLLGQIQWDQGDPYNRKCPSVQQYDQWGDASGKGPAATGCVATALGQIMYYHKWPEYGKDSVSYTSDGEEKFPVAVSFEGVKYNWDAMLPKLTSKSPSDAIDAVSTLLYHVGASFESAYGASTGATDISVAPALLKHFSYDQGIDYVPRDYYTQADWDSMLINELQNGRPVAYGGVTRRFEGHFFVLDGVNADGYYHVNWGWSGMEDGYYMLSLLEPGNQGIGGASDGGAFHYAQNMIIGIQKPVEGSSAKYKFTCDGLGNVDATIGRSESVTLKANGCWNNSPWHVRANFGFAVVDADGKTVYSEMVKKDVDCPVANGFSGIECAMRVPDSLPAGTYSVRPAYQLSLDNYATDRLMVVAPGQPAQYRLVIDGDKLVYSTEGAYALNILSIRGDNNGDLENGITKKVTVRFRNDGGEFHGHVQLRFFIDGKERVFGRFDFPSSASKAVWISIPGHSESEVTFDVGSFDLPGNDNWVVRLWGNEGTFGEDSEGYSKVRNPKNLCTLKNVKIVGPALPPVCELSDDMIVTTMVDGVAPRNDIGIKACITNEGGAWTGKMRMSVQEKGVWKKDPIGYVSFDPVTIEAETEEQWITLTGGELPLACEVGKTYELTLYDPVSDQAIIPSYYYSVEVVCGEAVDKIAKLSLDDLTFSEDKVMAGKPVDVQFHVINSGYAYAGGMSFIVSRNGETLHTSATQNVAIGRDDEAVIEFTETFELPTASDYVIALLDSEGKEIGRRDNLTFTADTPALELTESTAVPETVNCNEATEYVFGIKNIGFRFDSSLRFVILLSEEVKFTSSSIHLTLARGAEGTVKFTETVNLPDGDDYLIRLLTADDKTVGERKISLRGYVGIDLMENDADTSVRYFNLQGIEIKSPEVGQPVIVVKGTKTFKSVFR